MPKNRKEKAVAKATAERERQERAAKVQADYDRLQEPNQREEPKDQREEPKRRKPARRIIVHEASSASEEDDLVDVVLPKKRQPTETELRYQRTLNKMFYYDS